MAIPMNVATGNSPASAQTGAVNMITYSSSKGAIVTMTRSMAQEFGPWGITVNNIPPGSVMNTIMSEANRDRFQIPTEVLLSTIPVRRLGEPDDIAYAARYLASDESKFVTGTELIVDGGYGPITKDDRGRHENLVAENRFSRRSSRDI